METSPASMVLLLRDAHCLSEAQIRSAVARAWGIEINDESSHFVTQSQERAIVRVGVHLLSLVACPRPYFDSQDYADSLPRAEQRAAWQEHHAWIAIDYLGGGTDPDLEYGLIAKLAAIMLDSNCTGIYVPREGSFIPHNSSLRRELEEIAAARDPGIG